LLSKSESYYADITVKPVQSWRCRTSTPGKPAETTVATKSELNPLLRLLHNDSQKLAKKNNGDRTIKVSNPAMLAKIKISQLNTNIEDLPIMQTHLLTKLLAMTACTQIDNSGASSKAYCAFSKIRKRWCNLARVQDPEGPRILQKCIPPNA
jgi:hypothetical protein